MSSSNKEESKNASLKEVGNSGKASGTVVIKNAGSKKEDISSERGGLTTAQAEKLYEEVGFNELPHVEVSLVYLFFIQFTGLMPYMLEITIILAIAVQDYADFAIIVGIVLINAYLGFHEELKAKASLDELTNKMEHKIAVLRDGKAEQLLTRLLVPGDVVLLIGGASVPADVEWLEGDVLSIDTAALTGEPLPRKYPSDDHGKLILCGCTVREGEAYCVVRQTGIRTEVGSAQAEIMHDKTQTKISVFEEKVLYSVKIIIALSIVDVIIIFFVQGFARDQFNGNVRELILTCLSIIIAAIPVALPLVLQVTMALGAAKMATSFHAVVTSLPALQDISSMSILCSDKTGTLTTARISVHQAAVWVMDGYTPEELALFAILGSNRDKTEDPIDRSVTQYFDRVATPEMKESLGAYTKVRSVGFNPIYKRVLYEYTHPKLGTILVAKGLPNKVIDTADGGKDEAADQWKVEDFENVHPKVEEMDSKLSKAGYKTLGVSVKIGNAPFKFIGMLPLLDPPRHDTKETIRKLKAAGIKVKMITGDHLNIAKETARLIGMGPNILKGEETRNASQVRDECIWDADGFAQVLPRDKREVVLVLKNVYKRVVGMTGDGVNDAPALSAAQCGIAVDDATDAAKNAAAIILTSPGLSAIYGAVVESRRIFRKLKSYVIYRFAATIQFVVVLTLLIYISNCPINSLYIILLALFNDLTMLPIAYDQQQASAEPDYPNVTRLLMLSCILGGMEAGFTLLYAYVAHQSGLFYSDFDIFGCSASAQSGVWVQMFIAGEILIFSARTPSFIFSSIAPSPWLIFSVLLGCFIVCVLAAASDFFGSLYVTDILIIILYDILCLAFIDPVKVLFYTLVGEKTEVLEEEAETVEEAKALAHAQAAAHPTQKDHAAVSTDIEAGPEEIELEDKFVDEDAITVTRHESAAFRMSQWGGREASKSVSSTGSGGGRDEERFIRLASKSSSAAIIAARTKSMTPAEGQHSQRSRADSNTGRIPSAISVSSQYINAGSHTDLRRTKLSSSSLRPAVPSNLSLRK